MRWNNVMQQEWSAQGHTFLVLIFTFAVLFSCPMAHAQRESGAIGLGLQAGQPGGASFKLYGSGPVAYDGLFTTDGDDFALLYLHHLWEQPFPDSPLHVYVGPGLMLGGERAGASPVLRLGMSTEAGLNFYAERFEIFLHVTPTLHFLPRTTTQMGGSVGLRYYLYQP